MARTTKNSMEDQVLTTNESCFYLRITKPTFFKYIKEGRIRAIKAGKGWKVLKSELERFLRGHQRVTPEACFRLPNANISVIKLPSSLIRGWDGCKRHGEGEGRWAE